MRTIAALITLFLLSASPASAVVLAGVLAKAAPPPLSLTRTATGKILYEDGTTPGTWTSFDGIGTTISSVSGEIQITTTGAATGSLYYRTFTANTGIYVSAKETMKTANMDARLAVGSGGWGEKYCTDNVVPTTTANNVIYKSHAGTDTNPVYSQGIKEAQNTSYTEALGVKSGNLKWFKNGTQLYSGAQSEVTSFDRVFILAGGNPNVTGTFDNVAVTKSSDITITGVPSGKMVRIGGAGSTSKIATSAGSDTVVDCGGMMFPQTTIEILSSGGTATTGTVERTLTLTNDVWGGDTYAYQ